MQAYEKFEQQNNRGKQNSSARGIIVMSITLDLQLGLVLTKQLCQQKPNFKQWLDTAILPFQQEAEVTIRIVDEVRKQ